MYLKHFGLQKLPFTIAPDPDFLYPSEGHQEALAHLRYALTEQGGLIALTGEVGAGKTTLCREFMQSLPSHIHLAYIFNPQLTPLELLQTLCDELGIEYQQSGSMKHLFDCLNRSILEWYAKGERVICIIDEAQVMSVESLEQVRLLTNLETNKEKLLSLVLIGQPELRQLLSRHELRQLSQRITARYHLNLLGQQECRDYLRHRVLQAGGEVDLFIKRSADLIWKASAGIPRIINSIADRALLGAYAGNHQLVTVAITKQAIEEVVGDGQEVSVSVSEGRTKAGIPLIANAQSQLTPFLNGKLAAVIATVAFVTSLVVLLPKNETVLSTTEPQVASNETDVRLGVTVDDIPSNVIPDPVAAELPRDALESPGDTDISSDPVSLLANQLRLPADRCEQLAIYRYQCIYLNWSVADLKQINLPTAVQYQPGDWQLFADFQGSAPISALVLWQPPVEYSGPIKPGETSPLIKQVRQQLGMDWDGNWQTFGPVNDSIGMDGSFYDPLLAERVAQYQEEQGLFVDKVLGPKTLLFLQLSSL